jgi:imidazolonepropionase-like amidohydrolase
MWDRLLTGCNIATMNPAVGRPFGAIEDGAVAIQEGRIVRVGRRVEMAGMRAHAIESLGGAWVTPGLVDCHTHLVFGGNRAGNGSNGSAARITRKSPAPAAASCRPSKRRAAPRRAS